MLRSNIIAIFDSKYDADKVIKISKRFGYNINNVNIVTEQPSINNENNNANIIKEGHAIESMVLYGFNMFPYSGTNIGFVFPHSDRYGFAEQIKHEVQPGKTILSVSIEKQSSEKFIELAKSCGAERIMQ